MLYLVNFLTDLDQTWYKGVMLALTGARQLFSKSDPKWPTGCHFCVKNLGKMSVRCCILFIFEPIWIRLGTKVLYHPLQMHVKYFLNRTQNGRLAAIFVLKIWGKCPSGAVSCSFFNRFGSNLVQRSYITPYRCTSSIF